jgi:hypothetical protein
MLTVYRGLSFLRLRAMGVFPGSDLLFLSHEPANRRSLNLKSERPGTLVTELTNFTAKITPTLHETFSSWRENQRDDIVLAVSIACWYFERRGQVKQVTVRAGS